MCFKKIQHKGESNIIVSDRYMTLVTSRWNDIYYRAPNTFFKNTKCQSIIHVSKFAIQVQFGLLKDLKHVKESFEMSIEISGVSIFWKKQKKIKSGGLEFFI